MENAFSLILNMSLTGSLVIGLVLLGRLFLRKQPKIFSYALWGVVLFRLLCPVSISAPVSALEVASPAVESTGRTVSRISYVAPVTPAPAVSTPVVEKTATPSSVAAAVWLAGVGAMGLWGLVSWAALRRRLVGATPWRGNIYLWDYGDTPFVMGLISPKIYLPTSVDVKERRFIVAHERHHIRRLDHIWKALAYAALCLHWFNPLVWLSFLLAGKDMEMSCDEAVIRRLGEHTRADYAAALLRLSTKRAVIRCTPLAFGEGDTNGRVRNMANWKKPRVWVSLLCAAACVSLLVACAVNPTKEIEEAPLPETTPETSAEPTLEAGTYVQSIEHFLPEGYVFVNEELMTLEESGKASDQPHSVVGGLARYPIPEGLARDGDFRWLEEIGIPDVDDPSLAKIGGSDPHCDWLLEVFSDVPEGQSVTVHRYHQFTVVTNQEGGATLFDMWFDATQIDYSEFAGFLTFETLPAPETGDFEKTAFDLCGLVEARVGASSRHLHCEAESPEGRTIVDSYVMKNGNRLHIEEVDGTHREACMEVDGEYFYGTGAIGEPLTWKAISLEEYSGLHLQWLWLGTHPMYESRAEYKGTLGEEAGDFYVFTYQAPHPSRWPATQGQDTQCQIGFQFDPQGSFLWLTTFAPLQQITAKETIITLDEATVQSTIETEYHRATGQ